MSVKFGKITIAGCLGMTVNKKRYQTGPEKKDGKKGQRAAAADIKKTVKYTIERSKEDIKNLHQTVQILNIYFPRAYNTDSQIYRDLPKLTVKLHTMLQDLQKANDDLTVKQVVFEDLKRSICRINEIVKEK